MCSCYNELPIIFATCSLTLPDVGCITHLSNNKKIKKFKNQKFKNQRIKESKNQKSKNQKESIALFYCVYVKERTMCWSI